MRRSLFPTRTPKSSPIIVRVLPLNVGANGSFLQGPTGLALKHQAALLSRIGVILVPGER